MKDHSASAVRGPDHTCACCQQSLQPAFEVNRHQVMECSQCGHQQLIALETSAARRKLIASIYDDRYFAGGGDGYPDYPAEEDQLQVRGSQYARVLRRHGHRQGRLLDVGCAAGFLLAGLTAEATTDFTGLGIDPNRTMVELGRKRGLDLEVTTLEDLGAETEPFDGALLVQVIAHFDRPQDALARLATRVKAGKPVLVETWDRHSVTARAFGKRWHEYSPPSVRHWFTRTSLDTLMTRTGFEHRASGRPSRRLRLAHAASLLGHKLGFARDGKLVAWTRRIPQWAWLPYPGDDLFWALYERREP